MKVHLIQLLCPARHCIAAVAYQSAEMRPEIAQQKIQQYVDNGHVPKRCGICGATDLRYEDRPTIFKTLDDAEPTLKEMERANLASRAFLDAAGMTADSREARKD